MTQVYFYPERFASDPPLFGYKCVTQVYIYPEHFVSEPPLYGYNCAMQLFYIRDTLHPTSHCTLTASTIIRVQNKRLDKTPLTESPVSLRIEM